MITTQVKSQISADTQTKVGDINVTTSNGVVALSGTAASAGAIAHFKPMAESVQNIKSVDTSALRVPAAADQGAAGG